MLKVYFYAKTLPISYQWSLYFMAFRYTYGFLVFPGGIKWQHFVPMLPFNPLLSGDSTSTDAEYLKAMK